MTSLLTGIIDCVARPSTSDSPVRLIRKASSESPKCVSTVPELKGYLGPADLADSDSESSSNLREADGTVLSSSSSIASKLMMPSTGDQQATPLNSVLTAEGIIMGDSLCGAACGEADDDVCSASDDIDSAIVRQFEAAFATFLYKNPAFASMSHTNLQRLRAKLVREIDRNIKAEKELRQQLAELREAKRNREMELQQELFIVTRAKAAKEAELLVQIQKERTSTMLVGKEIIEIKKNHVPPSLSSAENDDTVHTSPPTEPETTSSPVLSWLGFGSSPPPSPTTAPKIIQSSSYEQVEREIQRNKMEQAHIVADMIRLSNAKDCAISKSSVNGTP